jgi:hypothetical protein
MVACPFDGLAFPPIGLVLWSYFHRRENVLYLAQAVSDVKKPRREKAMKGLGVTLGLVALLCVALLLAAEPTFAAKGGNGKGNGNGNGQDPPAWGHQKHQSNGGQQNAGGQKNKNAHGANDPAVPVTAPITYTATITLCHKPGTPAEKTLVLPAPAGPGHLRHGDYEGPCQEITPTVPTDTLPITATETVTICHKPGTPAEKTLVLPAAALFGHLRHGDEQGVCPDAAVAAAPPYGLGRNKR